MLKCRIFFYIRSSGKAPLGRPCRIVPGGGVPGGATHGCPSHLLALCSPLSTWGAIRGKRPQSGSPAAPGNGAACGIFRRGQGPRACWPRQGAMEKLILHYHFIPILILGPWSQGGLTIYNRILC